MHYKYTATHEWIASEGESLTMGITDHAQKLLGDLVYLELPEVGRTVTAGEEIGVVESVKAASDFYAPVSGTISAVNQQASDNPALVNQSPENAGWLVKIIPHAPEELAVLLDSDTYHTQLRKDH